MTLKYDNDAYIRDARVWQMARMARGSDDPDVQPPMMPADPTIDPELNVSSLAASATHKLGITERLDGRIATRTMGPLAKRRGVSVTPRKNQK
jgi:hypothetical protein